MRLLSIILFVVTLASITYGQCNDSRFPFPDNKIMGGVHRHTNAYTCYCCHCDKYKTLDSLPEEVTSQVRKELIGRGGSLFYSNLKLAFAQIVSETGISTADSITRSGVIPNINCEDQIHGSCSEFKYYFAFRLKVQDSIDYLFGFAADRDGKILSPLDFPKYDDNKSLLPNITYCEAHKLIENKIDTKKDYLNLFYFEYSEKYNCFIWSISYRHLDQKKRRRMKFYYVDAVTGELLIESNVKDRGPLGNPSW